MAIYPVKKIYNVFSLVPAVAYQAFSQDFSVYVF